MCSSRFFADSDGQSCMPYTTSLIKLADDHFSFLTAESEVHRPVRGTGSRVERRAAALEEGNQDLVGRSSRAAATSCGARAASDPYNHADDEATGGRRESGIGRPGYSGGQPAFQAIT